jgi:hypothetical protein
MRIRRGSPYALSRLISFDAGEGHMWPLDRGTYVSQGGDASDTFS